MRPISTSNPRGLFQAWAILVPLSRPEGSNLTVYDVPKNDKELAVDDNNDPSLKLDDAPEPHQQASDN